MFIICGLAVNVRLHWHTLSCTAQARQGSWLVQQDSPTNARGMFQGALARVQWVLRLEGMQADTRGRKLWSPYVWSIHFFCFVCLVGRQKREEGRKGGENTRVPARAALAWLLILLAVYFLMYRVFFFFFFNPFYSVSGQSYWLQNQFDNSFIKYCKK